MGWWRRKRWRECVDRCRPDGVAPSGIAHLPTWIPFDRDHLQRAVLSNPRCSGVLDRSHHPSDHQVPLKRKGDGSFASSSISGSFEKRSVAFSPSMGFRCCDVAPPTTARLATFLTTTYRPGRCRNRVSDVFSSRRRHCDATCARQYESNLLYQSSIYSSKLSSA